MDPIRIDLYKSDVWALSNVVQNVSFHQVDNFENGDGEPKPSFQYRVHCNVKS